LLQNAAPAVSIYQKVLTPSIFLPTGKFTANLAELILINHSSNPHRMKIFTTVNINSLNPAARLSSLAAQNPKIMKNTLKKLEDLQSSVEELVEKRQEVFDNRSEKWQESENGEKHQEITDKFTEILDQVTDWISDLESFQ